MCVQEAASPRARITQFPAKALGISNRSVKDELDCYPAQDACGFNQSRPNPQRPKPSTLVKTMHTTHRLKTITLTERALDLTHVPKDVAGVGILRVSRARQPRFLKHARCPLLSTKNFRRRAGRHTSDPENKPRRRQPFGPAAPARPPGLGGAAAAAAGTSMSPGRGRLRRPEELPQAVHGRGRPGVPGAAWARPPPRGGRSPPADPGAQGRRRGASPPSPSPPARGHGRRPRGAPTPLPAAPPAGAGGRAGRGGVGG